MSVGLLTSVLPGSACLPALMLGLPACTMAAYFSRIRTGVFMPVQQMLLPTDSPPQTLNDFFYKRIDLYILLEVNAQYCFCPNVSAHNMLVPQTFRSDRLGSQLEVGAKSLFVYSQLKLFVNLPMT